MKNLRTVYIERDRTNPCPTPGVKTWRWQSQGDSDDLPYVTKFAAQRAARKELREPLRFVVAAG
ncbi:MAG: hypothetical protein AMXMBFR7_26440 [Planctomycetota bacterium]